MPTNDSGVGDFCAVFFFFFFSNFTRADGLQYLFYLVLSSFIVHNFFGGKKNSVTQRYTAICKSDVFFVVAFYPFFFLLLLLHLFSMVCRAVLFL